MGENIEMQHCRFILFLTYFLDLFNLLICDFFNYIDCIWQLRGLISVFMAMKFLILEDDFTLLNYFSDKRNHQSILRAMINAFEI